MSSSLQQAELLGCDRAECGRHLLRGLSQSEMHEMLNRKHYEEASARVPVMRAQESFMNMMRKSSVTTLSSITPSVKQSMARSRLLFSVCTRAASSSCKQHTPHQGNKPQCDFVLTPLSALATAICVGMALACATQVCCKALCCRAVRCGTAWISVLMRARMRTAADAGRRVQSSR